MTEKRAGLLLQIVLCVACLSVPAVAQTPPAAPGQASSPNSKLPAETEDPVTIQLCDFDPPAIELGGSATLSVTLTGPAPRGGLNIGVDMDLNGSRSTIVGGPVNALSVAAGKWTVEYTLQTAPDPNPASSIGVTLSIDGAPACITRLHIS